MIKLISVLAIFTLSNTAVANSYLQIYGGNSSNMLPPDQSFLSLAILGDTLDSEVNGKKITSKSFGIRYGLKETSNKSLEFSFNSLGNNGYLSDKIFKFDKNIRSFGAGYRFSYSSGIYSRLGIEILMIDQSFIDKSDNVDYRIDSNINDEKYSTLGGYFSFGWSLEVIENLNLFIEADSHFWHRDDGKIDVEKFDSDSSEWAQLDRYDPKPFQLTLQALLGASYQF